MSHNNGVVDPDRLAYTTLRRVTWRLGVLLFFVYVLNYLDRTNISIAKLQMQPDIGISEAAFGLGAGLFFVGYVFFEVPSNIILYKVGARRWIARIMFSWGLVSMAMFVVQDEWTFYALRLLLGVAEAGLVPGVLLYLSRWVPAVRRARLIGVFYLAVPVSTIIGAPLSSWLMGFTPWGLAGWQFMFLAEGFPCLIVAFVVLRCLTDNPSEATWLDDDQRDWLIAQLTREEAVNAAGGRQSGSFAAVVRDKGVLTMSLAFFAMIVPLYALAFFLPTIVKQMGSFNTGQIGWLTAIPYVFAAVAMWLLARNSDRTGERTWHYVVPAAIGVVGLVLAAVNLDGSPLLALAGFTLAAIGCISTLPVFWSHAPFLLGGAAAATGIAYITAIGNIGGFVSPYMVALMKGEGPGLGSSAVAVLVTAVFLAVAAGAMALVGHNIRARSEADPSSAAVTHG